MGAAFLKKHSKRCMGGVSGLAIPPRTGNSSRRVSRRSIRNRGPPRGCPDQIVGPPSSAAPVCCSPFSARGTARPGSRSLVDAERLCLRIPPRRRVCTIAAFSGSLRPQAPSTPQGVDLLIQVGVVGIASWISGHLPTTAPASRGSPPGSACAAPWNIRRRACAPWRDRPRQNLCLAVIECGAIRQLDRRDVRSSRLRRDFRRPRSIHN